MKLTPNFYRDRVCLNVLAGSKANASAIYEAAEGHVLVGVLSKNYPDVASAVADMREYAALIDNALSVGLGAGDPNQSAMVSEISRQVQPQHVNQVFTGVATSRALLGQNESGIAVYPAYVRSLTKHPHRYRCRRLALYGQYAWAGIVLFQPFNPAHTGPGRQ